MQLVERSILAIALSGLAAGMAYADSINSVSCSTPTAPFVTSTSSCNSTGAYGYSQAAVSSSVLLPASANQAAVIDTSSTVSALQFGVHGIAGTATAQSSTDIGIIFDTSGPARNGLLELSFLQNGWQAPVNGSISESLAIGDYNFTLAGSSLASIWIPIQLGSEFGFEYLQSVTAIGSSASGLTSGEIASEISLEAFEADGVTGVQLFDPPGSPSALLATPEPVSLGIVAVGLTALLALSAFSRSKTRSSA